MKKYKALGVLLFLLVPLFGSTEEFQIRDGDRVVFWGDSITDNAFYPRSVENFVLSRFPDWTVEFHNLGWGGDRSVTLERMKRDLPQYDPTFVTIKLGMNDGSYTAFTQENYDRYITGYRRLLDFLRTHTQAEIVLISTVTYETDVVPVRKRDGQDFDMSVYPDTLRRFSEGVEELAKEYQTGYIDLNGFYAEALREGKANNPEFKLSGDAVHPNVNGQAYMAYYILKGLNAPGLIAEIVIDAQNGSISAETGSFVRNLEVKDNRIAFLREDSSLPFRFSFENEWDERLVRKEQWYNELNRDWLVVKNLAQPYALLTIDSEPIAILSREQLEQGVNLSLLSGTPMLRQGALLADLTEKRHQAEYTRWRRHLLQGVGSPYDFSPYKPETIFSRALKDTADFYHQMQLKYNDPEPHHFVLIGGEKAELEAELRK
ncbi:MAG: SGNH/GDSL hydrolase family protein [bacterium]